MKKKKIIYCIITFLLVFGLLGTNYIWYRIYKREQEKLKLALIPALINDYYSNRIAITKNVKDDNKQLAEQRAEEYDGNKYFTLKDIPLLNQNPDYPNGCEAVSATMLLNYYKIDITVQEFIEHYLMKDNVYEKDGKRYGPNPASYYAGDPKDKKRGWGVFEPVIEDAIQKVLMDYSNDPNFIPILVKGSESYQPLDFYMNERKPIMIWTTIDYEEVNEVYEWISYDKKNTYTYPKNGHAVIITGFDENYYYVNDPLEEERNIPVERNKLEKSFDSMGRQVIQLSFYDF